MLIVIIVSILKHDVKKNLIQVDFLIKAFQASINSSQEIVCAFLFHYINSKYIHIFSLRVTQVTNINL